MNEGSCCCGAVRFQVLKAPTTMGTCHCSRCRKAGASTMVFIKREDLQWVKGKDLVKVYRPEPPFTYGRCFCSICGTSLGEILSSDDSFPIAANAFDSELGLTNMFHEHIADKPSWCEIPVPETPLEDHAVSP